MPRSRSDDTSAGDARQPYADIGGTEARHAKTHDVRREELTNPKGAEPRDDSFDDDLSTEDGVDRPGGHIDDSLPAAEDKQLSGKLDDRLTPDEMARLTVLTEGTGLEQGGVYLDLNDAGSRPFKALGSQEAGPSNRYVAKRDLDHELWNKLAGDREPEIERPETGATKD